MPTAFIGNCCRFFPFSNGVPNNAPYMQWHQVVDAERWDDMDVVYGDMSALNHPVWGKAFRKRPLIDAADDVLSGDKLVSYRETIANPIDNAFWEAAHFTDEQLAKLDLPIFFTDGWYDMTVGPIDFFTRLERLRPGRADRYLLVGPWDHYQTASRSEDGDDNGDRVLPCDGGFDHVDLRLRFFDRYLKGDQQAFVQEDRVRVFITGAPDSNANTWKSFPTFPVPNTEYKPLYIHSQGDAHSSPDDGQLNWQIPTDEPADHYIYNPNLPTHSQVETSRDRRDVEIRSDVLTYTSQPLKEPLTILGDVKLMLHAASDAPDTDWFAVLTEVFPDGKSKSFHYAPPAFRARYREGMDKEVFLTPNKPEVFQMSLGPAGHQIAAGHCLRLSIFSSAFPEYEPNSNTGKSAAMDKESIVAKQTIFHDAKRPSHIMLPVIPWN
jgi:putative CocE/NonD family hydrolase